jgi:hypothetical protein
MNENNPHLDQDPVVVGGVGGSGTRLIARCLMELGYFMGVDLNESNDNLWFTLLFKRLDILSSTDEQFDNLIDIFLIGMRGKENYSIEQIQLICELASEERQLHTAEWLKERATSLLINKRAENVNGRWGWKEPNSHIVFPRLKKRFKHMKFIQVVRNGLDMAHSTNQNQLIMWGKHFFSEPYLISPYYSLKYWCEVHRRILLEGRELGNDFLFLNYDNFCKYPEHGIEELINFLELEYDQASIERLQRLINPPTTIGRFKQYGANIFDKEDLHFVEELGFKTF